MTTDGYKLPPTRAADQTTRAEARAERAHEPEARATAKREQRAADLRERPARPQATPAVRAGLRARARAEADLRFRHRAILASQDACTETRRACQERRRALEPDLQRLRQTIARSRDPDFAPRYRAALERLEAEAVELDETSAAMLAEHAQLRDLSREITAALAPLTAMIDAACARIGRTRAEIGIAIDGPYTRRGDGAAEITGSRP